jgi:hypothetical protein
MSADREEGEPRGELPVRAIYTVGELARAAHVGRRKLMRVLERSGVTPFRVGKFWLVSLCELEQKARAIWEAIKAAEMLRHVLDGR